VRQGKRIRTLGPTATGLDGQPRPVMARSRVPSANASSEPYKSLGSDTRVGAADRAAMWVPMTRSAACDGPRSWTRTARPCTSVMRSGSIGRRAAPRPAGRIRENVRGVPWSERRPQRSARRSPGRRARNEGTSSVTACGPAAAATVNLELAAIDTPYRSRGIEPAVVERLELPTLAPRALGRREQIELVRAVEERRGSMRDAAIQPG